MILDKNIDEIGIIFSFVAGIVRIRGFINILYGEKIEFENGSIGVVIGFDEKNIHVIIIDPIDGLKVGNKCKRLGLLSEKSLGKSISI